MSAGAAGSVFVNPLNLCIFKNIFSWAEVWQHFVSHYCVTPICNLNTSYKIALKSQINFSVFLHISWSLQQILPIGNI